MVEYAKEFKLNSPTGQPVQNYSSPIIFVRHGVTDWNLAGRYQGSTDTKLSSTGIEQARSNAEQILDLLDKGVLDQKNLRIVSSPLQRAKETAAIIVDSINSQFSINLDPTIEPAFRELSIGRWQGLTSQQVKDQFYEERKSRKKNRWNFKPTGGESMAERCFEIDRALSNLPPDTILVTHSVVLRIISHLLGAGSKEECAVLDFSHEKILCWNSAKLHRQPI